MCYSLDCYSQAKSPHLLIYIGAITEKYKSLFL